MSVFSRGAPPARAGNRANFKTVKYKRKYLEKSKSTTYQLAGPGGGQGGEGRIRLEAEMRGVN